MYKHLFIFLFLHFLSFLCLSETVSMYILKNGSLLSPLEISLSFPKNDLSPLPFNFHCRHCFQSTPAVVASTDPLSVSPLVATIQIREYSLFIINFSSSILTASVLFHSKLKIIGFELFKSSLLVISRVLNFTSFLNFLVNEPSICFCVNYLYLHVYIDTAI